VARAPADTFPAPYEDSYSTDEEQTPVSMGGGVRTLGPLDTAAARGLHASRGDRYDERLSAGLRRKIEGSRDRIVELHGSGTAVANTPLVITCGGPHQGFVWELKRLNVGPVDYSAGSFPNVTNVILIKSSQSTGSVADSAGQVISTTTLYPSEGTWGREECTVLAGEYLRVIVVGLSAGVVVTIGGQAIENAAAAPETYGF
jgi:hypothetical protein